MDMEPVKLGTTNSHVTDVLNQAASQISAPLADVAVVALGGGVSSAVGASIDVDSDRSRLIGGSSSPPPFVSVRFRDCGVAAGFVASAESGVEPLELKSTGCCSD